MNNEAENNLNTENRDPHINHDDKQSGIKVDNQTVVTNISHEDARQRLKMKTVEDVTNMKHGEKHVNDTNVKNDKSENTVLEESENSTTADEVLHA